MLMDKYDHQKTPALYSGRGREHSVHWISNVFINVRENQDTGSRVLVTAFYWMRKLIKWGNVGWKDRETEEKSGRTEGWLLTGHLAQAFFSLGEGRRGGRDGSHKYLTFHLSDWQTHTHKYQTPTNTPARTTAYICRSVLILRVNRFQARRRGNCVKVNNMAGGVLTRRRWRPGDEITVPPVGYNGDWASLACIHTHKHTQKNIHLKT